MVRLGDERKLNYFSLMNVLNQFKAGPFYTFIGKWKPYQEVNVNNTSLHFSDRYSLGELLHKKYCGVVVYDVKAEIIVAHCIGQLEERPEESGEYTYKELSRHVACDVAGDELDRIQFQLGESMYTAVGMKLFVDSRSSRVPQIKEWLSSFPFPHQLQSRA